MIRGDKQGICLLKGGFAEASFMKMIVKKEILRTQRQGVSGL